MDHILSVKQKHEQDLLQVTTSQLGCVMKLATNQTVFCYVYKTLGLLDNIFKIFDIASQEINFGYD